MTFKQLTIGDVFEYRDDAFKMKVAVKVSDKEAWFLEERKQAVLAHNRKAWKPQLETGRLAQDREGRVCVVHSLSNQEMVGYVVIPVAYVQGHKTDFAFIKVEPGEMRDEVDIIMQKISQSNNSLKTWLKALREVFNEL